jgi:hypothetical protein
MKAWHGYEADEGGTGVGQPRGRTEPPLAPWITGGCFPVVGLGRGRTESVVGHRAWCHHARHAGPLRTPLVRSAALIEASFATFDAAFAAVRAKGGERAGCPAVLFGNLCQSHSGAALVTHAKPTLSYRRSCCSSR